MFFALLMKNRERNMATPEETRDRIKEMRDRIFKDTDKVSTEKNIQEKAYLQLQNMWWNVTQIY